MNARRAGILAALAATQLIGVVNFSIVNIALPSIGRDFGLPPDELQWVVTAYVLMEGGFLLLGGRLCDVFDRKRVFLAALTVFAAGSLISGLAPNAILEFVARGVQGLGGSVLAPAALALVATEFEEGEARNRALGVFGTVAALGYIVGIVSGGFITGLGSWRWVFFINLPIVGLIFLAAAFLLRSQPVVGRRPSLDVAGAVTGTLAVIAAVAGLAQLGAAGAGWLAAPLIVAAGGLGFALVRIERASQSPLMPLSIFTNRRLSAALAVAGLTYVGNLMVAFTLTLLIQRGLHYSPQATGLVLAPAGVGGIVGAALAGSLYRRTGPMPLIVGGLAVLAVGIVVIGGPGIHASVFWISAGYTLGGVGLIACLVTCTIVTTSAVDVSRLGLAGGLLNTIQFVSGAFGTALGGIVDADGTIRAYSTSLFVAAGFIVVAAAVALVALRAPSAGAAGITPV